MPLGRFLSGYYCITIRGTSQILPGFRLPGEYPLHEYIKPRQVLVLPISTLSITMPTAGSIYIVINEATGTAINLNLEDGKTVTGCFRNGQENQRVRFTVSPQFPLPSVLISIITFQWRFIKGDESYWAIQSVATDGYLDVEKRPPANNDNVVVVKTDTPLFTWEHQPDGQ
jgi:hypothetical protein